MKIETTCRWVETPDEDCPACRDGDCGNHGRWEYVQYEHMHDRRFANFGRAEEGDPVEALAEAQRHWPKAVALVHTSGQVHDPCWEVVLTTVGVRWQDDYKLVASPTELASEMAHIRDWVVSAYETYCRCYPDTN